MKSSGIGGQAVIEGVMMKNKEKYAVSVRKPDNEIVVDVNEYISLGERHHFLALPIIRGVVTFFESMVIGVKTITYSSSFYDDSSDTSKPDADDTATKNTKKAKTKENIMMAGTIACSVLLAIAIFMLLPYFISTCLVEVIDSAVVLTLIEGLVRLALFIGYVLAISLMKDIRRVFMYHGAEHKAINCIEHGLDLNIANVRGQSKQHKRCGTSFLLIVMLLSIVFFMFIRVDTAWLRVVLRLVLIPVIAGVSYEFIKLAGRHDTPLMNLLSKPGLLLQGLTTKEPDDSMIEVAISSVEAVFDWKAYLAEYENEKKTVRERKRRRVKDVKDTITAGEETAVTEQADDVSIVSIDGTVAEMPGTKKSIKDKSKAGKTVVNKPMEDKLAAEKTTIDKPIADKSAAEKTVTDKPVADKPAAEKTTIDKPVADKPAAEKTMSAMPEENSALDEVFRDVSKKRRPGRPPKKKEEPAAAPVVQKTPIKTNEPMASYKVIEEDPEDDDILKALDRFFVEKHDKDDDGLE